MPIVDQQQLKKQHPIPQNIMSVEFKLIGDMTIRQFFYVAVGGVLSFVIFKSGLPFILKFFGVFTFGLGGLGLAFVPLQERGLDVWLKSFIRSINTSTQMVWKKSSTPPAYFLNDYSSLIKIDVLALAPAKSRSKLYKYLNTVGKSEDLDETDLHERGFLGSLNYNIEIPEKLADLVEVKTTKIDADKTLPAKPVLLEDNRKVDRAIKQIGNNKFKVEQVIVIPKPPIENKIETPLKEEDQKNLSKETLKQAVELQNTVDKIKSKREKKQKSPKEKMLKLKPSKIKRVKIKVPHKSISDEIKMVIAEIKNKPHQKLERVLKEEEIHTNDIPSLKSEAATDEKKDNTQPITNEIKIPKVESNPKIYKSEVKTEVEDTQIPNKNILIGQVKDKDGHVLENAIILVKNAKGEAERALKSNVIGEFKVNTPLVNGKYFLETSYNGLLFDVINFEARGLVLDPFIIVSKT